MVCVIKLVELIKLLIDIRLIGECKYFWGSEIVKVIELFLVYCNLVVLVLLFIEINL